MIRHRLKLTALFLLGLGLTGLRAQTSVNATGGDASGSGGSASYSVGQAVYTPHTGIDGSVAQGVQQPFEISRITGIEEAKGIELSLSAYPNPTAGNLILSIGEFDVSNLTYRVFDMQGKLLRSAKITDNRTDIAMNDLVPATYFVRVSRGNEEVTTFKIMKK